MNNSFELIFGYLDTIILKIKNSFVSQEVNLNTPEEFQEMKENDRDLYDIINLGI